MTKDEIFMHRCLQLAEYGLGKVSPNPMVGCVIVRNGKIIAEGYHKQFGGPHAEVFALLHAGNKAKGAKLYVNLEPCAHFGKTPPCVDAIIKAEISKVIIGTTDPNPLVSGKGVKILRANGIAVTTGVLESEAKKLNEKFFKYISTGLPFVGLKLAQTIDGRISDIAGKSKWITSNESRKFVHKLRTQYDAVMIGANTVLMDEPKLTVRNVKGCNPLRIVVDGKLSVSPSHKIFNTAVAPTWILTSSANMKIKTNKVQKFAAKGVRIIGVAPTHKLKPTSILKILGREGISSVLIEGGASVVSEFINYQIVNRLHLFVSPKILGGGLNSFILKRPKNLESAFKLSIEEIKQIDNDLYLELIIDK